MGSKRTIGRYLIRSMVPVTSSIFLAFFMVASIVMLIQYAAMTAVVRLSFLEFLQLYTYLIPQLLSYTLPLSFFAGALLTLTRLSMDMETMVLFALGARPMHILRPILAVMVALSLLMLVLTLLFLPMSRVDMSYFMQAKRQNAELNLRASELGQKFGDWLIFAGSKDAKTYHDIVLYHEQPEDAVFVAAKSASLLTEQGGFALYAQNGVAYYLPGHLENTPGEALTEITFQGMRISQATRSKELKNLNIIDYWLEAQKNQRRSKEFAIALLTSLLPLLLAPIAVAGGIVNPRYQKNHSYWIILIVGVLYYSLMTSVAPLSPIAFGGVVLFWLTLGWWWLARHIFRRY